MSLSLKVIQDSRNVLTQSRLSARRQCPFKEWLLYEVGLRPNETPEYFRVGTGVHDGVEVLSNGGSIAEAVEAGRRGYAEIPVWMEDDNERIAKWMVEAEIVSRLIVGYEWYFGEWNKKITFLSAEELLAAPVRNPRTGRNSTKITSAGKSDGLIQIEDLGDEYVLHEVKTVGCDISDDAPYWRRWQLSPQADMYVHLYRQRGITIRHILVTAIRKPTIRPKRVTAKDQTAISASTSYFGEAATPVERETPRMYGARLRHDMSERPDYYFNRRLFTRSEKDILDYEGKLWSEAQETLWRRRTKSWPRNTHSCFGVGLGTCQCFDDICSNRLEIAWEESGEIRPPEGWHIVDAVHSELQDVAEAASAPASLGD